MNIRETLTRYRRAALAPLLALSVLVAPLPAHAGVVGTVYEFAVQGFGLLVMAGGAVLNYAIEFFVIQFSSLYLAEGGFGTPVEETWAVIRDLFNIALIFGLVYVGFRFILYADDGQAKKNLVTIILAALLVNFSLFIAKAIIDLTNSFVFVIIRGLAGPSDRLFDWQYGISGEFMRIFGISDIFNPETASFTVASEGVTWGIVFMTIILFLIAAFVFTAIGIMLTIRFLYLVFLIIFSPVLFLGWVFPQFSGLSTRWLRTFLNQAILAPAVVFLLLISLGILGSMRTLLEAAGGMSDVTEAYAALGLGGEAGLGDIAYIPYFILGAGFMIASLLAARALGAAGANASISLGQNITRRVRNYVQYRAPRQAARGAVGAARGVGKVGAATAGSVGRNVIGRSGDKYVKSASAQERAQAGGFTGWVGQKALSVSDKARNASFDARNTSVGGAVLGKGIGGKGKDTSYKKRQDQYVKEQERLAKLASEGSAQDAQIYKDNEVFDVYADMQHKKAERSRLIAERNKTQDQADRKRLTREISRIDSQIQETEAMTNKTTMPDSYRGSEDTWNKYKDQVVRYNKVRKDMDKIKQNAYAADLAQRQSAWMWQQDANQVAAEKIRRETTKDKDDKLLDAIKASKSS